MVLPRENRHIVIRSKLWNIEYRNGATREGSYNIATDIGLKASIDVMKQHRRDASALLPYGATIEQAVKPDVVDLAQCIENSLTNRYNVQLNFFRTHHHSSLQSNGSFLSCCLSLAAHTPCDSSKIKIGQ